MTDVLTCSTRGFWNPGSTYWIEGRGISGARLVLGTNLMTGAASSEPGGDEVENGVAAEAGISLASGLAWSDVGQAAGLHLALGWGNPVVAARAQGMIPWGGDRRNWDAGAAFTLNPEAVIDQ